eukprot:scaffold78004_cov60-Phaeocystis_antarctica.AAC.2
MCRPDSVKRTARDVWLFLKKYFAHTQTGPRPQPPYSRRQRQPEPLLVHSLFPRRERLRRQVAVARVEHAEDQAAAALLDGLGVVEDAGAQVDHVPDGVIRVHDRLRGQPVGLGDHQLAALAEAHVAVGHHRVDDGADQVAAAVAVLVDPEVEAVTLALVVRAESLLEPHRHAWVVQLDHLARVGVQLLKYEARLLRTRHHLVALHVVEVVLATQVMLLKLGPEGVAVLLEQPRRAEEIPRELQHLLRRHRRRQHRVAPVARPGGTRLRHPLRHRGVVQWAFACHQQGRRRARGRGRRLSLLAVCLGLRRHCCLVVGALPGSAASASISGAPWLGAVCLIIAHCGRVCDSNALDPRQVVSRLADQRQSRPCEQKH